MAGIYIHIPFCKQACHYCNFHFSTSLGQKDAMIEAIRHEIFLQKNYLNGQKIDTIYFGGGTPSLLSAEELTKIIDTIHQYFFINKNAEITLEANPDDLTETKIQSFKRHTPINRLSIGVQSFSEDDLRYMNRAHNAEESKKCIQNAQNQGFENLTIDLIYGSPTTSNEQWLQNLETVFELQIPHLSSYALTVEPKTILDKHIQKGITYAPDEEKTAQQFQILMSQTAKNNFEHYEISNFAKNGQYARHNTAYWTGNSYLALGPSAHSFDGNSRQWNISNNALYIKSLANNKVPFEIEILTAAQQYNEYVMTALRTMWGCDLKKIQSQFPSFESYFLQNIAIFVAQNNVFRADDHFKLTPSGKLLADGIASALFFIE